MTSFEKMAVPCAEKLERAETGLNSPPETHMKDTSSDSELSDLEPDLEKEKENVEEKDDGELGEIHPVEYSPDGTVPIFKPTMEEFEDFQRYMRAIQAYGMRHGIIKVIPPAEWLAKQPRLDDIVKTIRIKEPISQDIMGASGTYRQANILHQRSYSLPQWRQLCDQSEHQPPAKRGERRAAQERPVRAAAPKPAPKAKATPARGGAKKKGPKGKGKKGVSFDIKESSSTPDRLPTPDSPSLKATSFDIPIKSTELGDDECDDKPKGGRQPKAISVSSRRKYNRREGSAAIDEESFKNFDYELNGVDYSQERCDELERSYWKSLTYAPPLYGADMMGSLFDDRTTTWNLGKLDNILDVLGAKIPGVNTAYLYMGMWKATFAWHLEDVDLYSINYLHFGAPKQWYSISQGDARRFEAAMKTVWPADAKACDQFLRHKTFLISPAHLMQNFNIKVNKIVHRPGEFVITFPYGYHSGYNLGYNCAEAVNFGLESWLPYGRVAKKCDCDQAQDSVWIDVAHLDRKLRGEDTEYEETEDEEEEEEDEDDGLEITSDIHAMSGGTKIKAPPKKRKRPTNERITNPAAKKIRVRIKGPSKEPCILCPNDIPSEPLLFTEDGLKAHRICAQYIPETSIAEGDKEIVTDVKYIDKARLELKCNYCRSKKGACFQCSQKKCTRAYHATCAAAAGVLVEQGEIPVFGEDGTEYKEWGIEFSCRFHRVKRDNKKVDADSLGENERILKAAALLKVGERCQMQYYKGDIFAGTVVENNKSEETLLLDILPRGDRVEVQYKWLLIPDPADYRLIKPSANAIPMPKSFKDKESLNTSKRAADDLPRADDNFVEGFTWSEFRTEVIPRNPAQVRIDLGKSNQMWYYLGKNSTEAKAQFTEDPSKPRHNPQGHFLDTIPKPHPTIQKQSYSASYPSKFGQTPAMLQQKPAFQPADPNVIAYIKRDRPYVYKPRMPTANNYHVDPQAYSSQQSFIQQSQPRPLHAPQPQQAQISRALPYAFGTDPRWQSPAKRAAAEIQAQRGNQGPSPLSWNPAMTADTTPYTVHTSVPRPMSAIRPPSSSSSSSIRPLSSSSSARLAQSTSSIRPLSSAAPILPPQNPNRVVQASPPILPPQPSAQDRSLQAKPILPPQSTTPNRPTPSTTPILPPQSTTQARQSKPILPPQSTPYNRPNPAPTAAPASTPTPTPKPTPTLAVAPNRPPPSATPLAVAQNQYRPHVRPAGQTPAYPTKPLPNNPFSGRTQNTKPNPFAKYSYLQKEHNRSPLEYKTPYRPGGGFMNGYQGDTIEYYRKTLFQDRPTSSSLPHAVSYISRTSCTQSPQPSTPYSSGSASSYSSYNTPAPQQQPALAQQHVSNGMPQNSWERKEAYQLHPAIRQEYGNGTMFQGDYQPPPPRPSQLQYQQPSQPQYHSHVMQPPAMYDRQASQSQGYQAQTPAQPRQIAPPEYRQPHTSLSAAHPQSYNQASASHNTIQQQPPQQVNPPPRKSQAKVSKQKTALVIPQTQAYQAPPQIQKQQNHTAPLVTYHNESQAMFTPQQFNAKLQHQPAPVPQPQMTPQSPYQESKPIYAHQQQHGGEFSQNYAVPQELQNFTDVPVDSTSIIEKLMQNLRKVPEQRRS